MRKRADKRATLALATNGVILLALAGSLLAVVVTGQLLSDLSHPAYYVDQSAIGDQPDPQDPTTYWALSEQPLRPPVPVDDSLLGYQSPTLDEAMQSGQLLEAILSDELRRRARLENEQVSRQELIDMLLLGNNNNNNNKETEEKSTATPDDNEELKISPPVNNPLEFEAAAKIMKHLSLAANNSSPASDIISLDTLLSSYLNNLVKDIDNDSNSTAEVSSKVDASSGGSNNIVSETRAISKSTQQPKQQEQQKEVTTPASRYGSAEYIDHPLAIIGHQYVQGGAGEGKQLLGPDGTFENVQVVKTDHAVPSYCDPPNPCPIGFTAEDGCLENFVNSASSSREYQAEQQCSCDNEHSLFNCASPISTLKGDLYSTESGQTTSNPKQGGNNSGDDDNRIDQSSTSSDSRLETLARTIQNRFGGLSSIQNLISSRHDDSSNSLD